MNEWNLNKTSTNSMSEIINYLQMILTSIHEKLFLQGNLNFSRCFLKKYAYM